MLPWVLRQGACSRTDKPVMLKLLKTQSIGIIVEVRRGSGPPSASLGGCRAAGHRLLALVPCTHAVLWCTLHSWCCMHSPGFGCGDALSLPALMRLPAARRGMLARAGRHAPPNTDIRPRHGCAQAGCPGEWCCGAGQASMLRARARAWRASSTGRRSSRSACTSCGARWAPFMAGWSCGQQGAAGPWAEWKGAQVRPVHRRPLCCRGPLKSQGR